MMLRWFTRVMGHGQAHRQALRGVGRNEPSRFTDTQLADAANEARRLEALGADSHTQYAAAVRRLTGRDIDAD